MAGDPEFPPVVWFEPVKQTTSSLSSPPVPYCPQSPALSFSTKSSGKSKSSRYFPDTDAKNVALFEKYRNKIITPSKEEIDQNNSSRSAKLRFAIRSNNKFIHPSDLFQKFGIYLELEAINV